MIEAVFVALLICGIPLPLGLVQAVAAHYRPEKVWGKR